MVVNFNIVEWPNTEILVTCFTTKEMPHEVDDMRMMSSLKYILDQIFHNSIAIAFFRKFRYMEL